MMIYIIIIIIIVNAQAYPYSEIHDAGQGLHHKVWDNPLPFARKAVPLHRRNNFSNP
jgi:hypothetical protein